MMQKGQKKPKKLSFWNITRLGCKVVSIRKLFFEGELETYSERNVKGSQSYPKYNVMVEDSPINTNPFTDWRLDAPERLWKLFNFWEVFGKKSFWEIFEKTSASSTYGI
jgi:hypothetical protein